MIVTCPDCDTSFQLDESRIPQKGIRVRCSRCKHAFHLAHPSVSQSEAIDAVAQEAVTGGGASSPSVTQDLVDPGTSASSAAPRSEINNEDAAEWEFNQDIPSTDEGPSNGDDGFFDTGLDRGAPSGLDLATDEPAVADAPPEAPESEPDLAATPEPVVADPEPSIDVAAEADSQVPIETAAVPELDDGPAVDVESEIDVAEVDADASAFGTVDDFSSLMDDDPLDAIASPEADDTADDLRAQAAEQSGLYAAEAQADDLGDPEKWDFFDGAPPPSTPAAPAPRVTLGRIGQLSGSASATDDLTNDWNPAPVADLSEKGRIALLAESAGRIVGWTVVIVGFGLGLVSGLWGTAESFVTGERATPIGPLEAIDMRAKWVDTARAGRLLVVSGGLRNPTGAPVVIPGALEIAPLDRLGDRLDLPAVSAGVVLSERQLRELPAEVLTRVRAQAAAQLQSVSIPAGGLLPFQVVLFDAPASGLRFEARLAESGELSLPEPVVPVPVPKPVSEAEGEEPASLDESSALEPNPAQQELLDEPARAAPSPNAAPTAPGYDDPYGGDAGMGLQDL